MDFNGHLICDDRDQRENDHWNSVLRQRVACAGYGSYPDYCAHRYAACDSGQFGEATLASTQFAPRTTKTATQVYRRVAYGALERVPLLD
jgi:hypothetical protein